MGNLKRSGGMAACTALLLGTTALHAQAGLRTLHGTVTDRQHGPLKGADVEVQDEVTGSVMSFIADRNGGYSFKRLSGGDDYKVWATYRGKRSKNKEMGHFDSKPDKVILLVITLD